MPLNRLFKSLSDAFATGVEAICSLFSDAPTDEKPSADEPLPHVANDNVVINGVALPQNVIDQLRQHGFNPEWCSRCELEAAEQEALVDGTVFHDPDGNDFFDDLELTEEEREEDDGEMEPASNRPTLHVRPDEDHAPSHEKILPMSFCETEKRRRKEKLNHANDDGSHGVDSHDGH